ncbi:2OG-Fe(II) oxygenase [Paraburkholderia strydomiana]|uniref:2OG-Fe(II) oxygenase n=1 Tax=Paraburkholderia strydomiana TaxID=1245417 RepID=UPI001BE580E1|nr:2OG-Fe(II) oxygenase [Paraburkholderia strydomiana]MBT2790091.1 2OG-Fe(II) oxygenase [Paraburkholderia strydomiana]
MSITVNFPAQVRDWIAHNLTRGVATSAIVQELVGRNNSLELASAMVDAVSSAFMYGAPLPGETIVIGAAPLTYQPEALRIPDGPLISLGERKARVIARMQRPAAVQLASFLSANECEQLIALARPRLDRSTVVDPVTGRQVVAGHRSSHGMFFRLGETPLISRLEARIAELTGLPVENGEGLQLLHYEAGAESTPHVDYLVANNASNIESIARSGQRMGTLLMYLNDVDGGGGETVFPHLGWSVTPRRGDALYFGYGNRSGLSDPSSLHASKPLRAGEKWVATKWIRTRRFVPRDNARDNS